MNDREMMTLFLIFFPLFVAIILFAFRPSNAKVWALAGSLVELVVSLVVAVGFVKMRMIPNNMPKSPMRFMMNALLAASL